MSDELEARITQLEEALTELVNIVDDSDAFIDSFTTQPARIALRTPASDWLAKHDAEVRAKAIEEAASMFEQEIGWHNDECPVVTRGHPWYACGCEVRLQGKGIRALITKPEGES